MLVMWLVAAMSITVSGALALAREEIGLASSRLGEAQAFALGKGIARLAVMDRARAQTAPCSVQSWPEKKESIQPSMVFLTVCDS